MIALAEKILKDPTELRRIKAEVCKRSFYRFVEEFWPEVSANEFVPNWHIEVFCDELSTLAERVGRYLPKRHDLIINVPPGTTKTIIFSIMFPVWCWTNWYWMRFITGSYSSQLSLESAEYSRDLVRSDKFVRLFPHITIKRDKDTKGNFRVQMINEKGELKLGGNRYSTSVGGTLTGFHGHINIVDDPLNPTQAASDTELKTARNWMDQTLSTRKVDKQITPTVLVMQRLSQEDPTGHWLAKEKKNLRHICLPGEIRNFDNVVNPPELKEFYIDQLLDVKRMGWGVLHEMEADLGQYGYAGQVGQSPAPPGGGMFKVENFQIIDAIPSNEVNSIVASVRYWDKAGTQDGGKCTAGVLMHKMGDGRQIISDVVRGQWGADRRENRIKQTAAIDGIDVKIWVEQEPGSGGKESAESTVRNLAGFVAEAEKVTGNKEIRAEPYSIQVNAGNVLLLKGEWNLEFIKEHEIAPHGKFQDQWDAAGGAFNKLNAPVKEAGVWGR